MQEINYQSKLLFRNYKKSELPPYDTTPGSAYLQFWEEEQRKCKRGITINGIWLPGTLYYAFNHVKLTIEGEDEFGDVTYDIIPSELRDTDWEIHKAYNEATAEKKGLFVGSSRQIGKTATLVTLVTHEINFTDNAEILYLSSNSADEDTFIKYLDNQIKNNTPELQIPCIDKDLTKNTLRFGHTYADNTTEKVCTLYKYNTGEGKKVQIGSGKTVSMYVYDENAKADFLRVQEAVIPAITTKRRGQKGLKAKMFHCMTGGDAKTFKDAKTVYYNPEAYHFKAFGEDKTGFFLDATYQSPYKVESTLGDFLMKSYGKKFENEELDNALMYVKDEEYALKDLEYEMDLAKALGADSYNMRRMFNPMIKSDIFLSADNNIFSHLQLELEKLKDYLVTKVVPTYKKVDLIRNKKTNAVEAVPSNKPILVDFPLKNPQHHELDTAIVILEEPRFVDKGKLYVMGADLINVEKTDESPSLGSFYLMQRTTVDYEDPYNDKIIAFYNGRKDLNDYYDKLLSVLYYYNAPLGIVTLLHEAPDDTLTQKYSEKYIGYFLEDTYALSREINPRSNSHNQKGLRPTVRNQTYYLNRILEYMEEPLEDGRLGLWRINDPYLVSQLMAFSGALKETDAIVAFGHAITHLFKERHYTAPKAVTLEQLIQRKEQEELKPKLLYREAFSSQQKYIRRNRV